MKAIRLKRRSFLRGLGGAALALPTLQASLCSTGTSYADGGAGLPKRFFTSVMVTSVGGSGDSTRNLYAPNTTGFDYDLTGRIAAVPLMPVKDQVSIVSNLKIGMAKDNGGVAPIAGIADNFHGRALKCQFQGRGDGAAGGLSVDQLVGEQIGAGAPFKTLQYAVQARTGGNTFSMKRNARGDLVKDPAQDSPQQAWSTLMSAYTPPDAGAAEQRNFQLERRRSVLDLVASERDRLVPRLGRADKVRLEQHFDEVRDLELRLAALASSTSSGSCTPVPDPGADPPRVNGSGGSGGNVFYYADEPLRAQIYTDLVFMAFACDMTRVATINYANQRLWVEPIIGVPLSFHGISHNGGQRTRHLSEMIAWKNGYFAQLVERLRDTPEGAGTMLDHSVLTSFYEGGHGRSPEAEGDEHSHSTENMIALIAGCAGGLAAGQHLDAAGAHPAQVNVTAMRALGITDPLGDIGTDLPQLFAGP